MDDVKGVAGRIRRAEREINDALASLRTDIGHGWKISVCIAEIDVSSFDGPAAISNAYIEATLTAGGA